MLSPVLPLLSTSAEHTHSTPRRATAPAGQIRRFSSTSASNPCARSSASLSGTWCSRLCQLSSSGSAFSRLATVGHGAAVLGHRGRHPSSSSPPCLATFPPSPASREPHAPSSLPWHGRQWPPASLAEPRHRGVTAPAWPSPRPSQAERPWADALPGRLTLPFARAAQAKCGSGPIDSSGPAQ